MTPVNLLFIQSKIFIEYLRIAGTLIDAENMSMNKTDIEKLSLWSLYNDRGLQTTKKYEGKIQSWVA